MGYTPNNPRVYLAACAGMLAGMGARGQPILATEFAAIAADAYARAVDTLWGSNPFTAFELDGFRTVCVVLWAGRSPLPLPDAYDPGAYTQAAAETIALVRAGTAQVESQGISPEQDSAFQKVPFTRSSPAILPLQVVQAGQILSTAAVIITQPFDDPAATVRLGTVTDPGFCLAGDDVNVTVRAAFGAAVPLLLNGPDTLQLSVSAESSTVGAGVLLFRVV